MTVNIDAIDHLEFYVDNIDDSASHLCEAFGFRVHGYGGPETGLAGCRSLLLRQRDITILLTSAISDEHPAAGYVRQHGDGVAVVAMTVDDARGAFAGAVDRGALPVAPPAVLEHDGARVTFASVDGFGDVAHRFVTRDAPDGPFGPGMFEETVTTPAAAGLLKAIDHLAVCLPAGELNGAVRRYQDVFGFTQTFEERILVGSQAMNSKVVQSGTGGVTLTILEPDTTRAPGQIDEFVRANGGAGVQHVAFLTEDITAAVRMISGHGVRFLATPASYYDALPDRLGPVGVPLESLRDLNILADRDNWGIMLQIFTESRHPRRTYFQELIDRRGARSFGSNNIKALYEAVDRQQTARQTLST
jgi:4-hydroxymandelate synthase